MGQPAFSWLMYAGFAGAALAFSALPNTGGGVSLLLLMPVLGLASAVMGRGGGAVGVGRARWRPGRLARPAD
jgi:hypothetical protein